MWPLGSYRGIFGIFRRVVENLWEIVGILSGAQLLDEVFVISRIIKGYQSKPKTEAYNPSRDLDYSGCHKNPI